MIDISESQTALVDRLEDVLVDELPDVLDDLEDDGYPLDVPATWVRAREDFDAIDQHLGAYLAGPSTYGTILPYESDLQNRGTGSGDFETYDQITQVAVAVVFKRGPSEIPTRAGRELLQAEWERIRADKYRGALQQVLPRHAEDGEAINRIALNRSVTSPPVEEESGTYRNAIVVIDVLQHVRVPVRQS